MAVETVNDTNLGEFCQSEQAVLVLGRSTCPRCQDYVLTVIKRITEALPEVRFGQAWLDRLPKTGSVWGVGSKLYPGRQTTPIPTTLVLQARQDIVYFAGVWDYEDALGVINQILNPGKDRLADYSPIFHFIKPDSFS